MEDVHKIEGGQNKFLYLSFVTSKISGIAAPDHFLMPQQNFPWNGLSFSGMHALRRGTIYETGYIKAAFIKNFERM